MENNRRRANKVSQRTLSTALKGAEFKIVFKAEADRAILALLFDLHNHGVYSFVVPKMSLFSSNLGNPEKWKSHPFYRTLHIRIGQADDRLTKVLRGRVEDLSIV